MKLVLISIILLSGAKSQTNNDWGCNHYNFIPTDLCLGASTYAFRYICDGKYSITQEIYPSYDDCGVDTPTSKYSISLNGTAGSNSECDNIEPCGYFEVLCEVISYFVFSIDVCYSITASPSYYYECLGATLSTKAYWSNDCTGNFTETIIDYAYQPTYQDCSVE